MTATKEMPTNAELVKSIHGGDNWAIVVLCNRTKPKTVTELADYLYGSTRITKKTFDRLADAFDVYEPDAYKQPIKDYGP